MLKTLRSILIALSIFILIIGLLLGYKGYQSIQYQSPKKITVEIPKGSSVKKIARLFEENEVIDDKYVFEYYLRLTGKSHLIKAGEYEIEPGQNLSTFVSWLIKGKVKQYKFTVPEGYSIKDICTLFVKKKIMEKLLCFELTKRVDFLNASEGIESLEGYLFPDTYYYEKSSTPEAIIKQMVALFYKKLGEEVKANSDKEKSLYKTITLASIIEKETSVDSERGTVSGVYQNRLNKGMLLQSDPTVIYGIPNFDGDIRKKDLEKDTPYNTYTRPGLPKGPICNPGLPSIEAAISPAPTEFLYFVAKGDGSHYFSKTLEEHNKAVRYYQLKQGQAPGQEQ